MTPAPAAMHDRARELFRAGEYYAAGELYRRIVKAEPRNGRALGQLGMCLVRVDDVPEGVRLLAKAVSMEPMPELYHNLAFAYRRDGRLGDAIGAAERGLKLRPDDPDLASALSDFRWAAGDLDGAWSALAPHVAGDIEHPAIAVAFARLCARQGRAADGIAALERFAGDESLSVSIQSDIWFRLGDLLDREGEYDRAFAAYAAGNALVRAVHEPDAFARAIDEVIDAWTPKAAAGAGRSSAADTPVLVLGMPRSGTTLVEQIIASHPQATGAGEVSFMMDRAREMATRGEAGIPMCPAPGDISKAAADRMARSYMRELRRAAGDRGRSAAVVTDKMPLNFLYLGLIASIVPRARIIHCVRDPMDTGVSCFFRDFAGSVAAMASLECIGRFIRDERRLIEHWRSVLEIEVLDVVYEDLVADLEGQTRRVLEFVGLEFDERCLRFHESDRVALTASVDQVRQPLYKSAVGRWRNYEQHLAPLRAALDGGE